MSREFRVGLMFTLSLTILAAAFYFLGSFQETLRYKIQFDKVNGLSVDSPVHFNGVPIGRVTKVVLSGQTPTGGAVPIIVSIAVHRSVREHIRQSTLADIKAIGVLGDKYVLIYTPDYSVPVLDENEFIATAANPLDVDKLLEQGTDFVTDIGLITKDLKVFLAQLSSQDGALQRLVNDKELGDQLSRTLRELLANLERDDNFTALLLNDPEFAATFKTQLSQLMNSTTGFMGAFKDSKGMLPALLNDEAYKLELQGQLRALLTQGQAYVERLSNARGLAYRLLEDEAYGQRVAENLEKASFHLASILEKIDEGDGSAALILNDPSLYQGLYQVVYGLEHSGISKWYIQRKRRKGENLIDKIEPQEEPQPERQ